MDKAVPMSLGTVHFFFQRMFLACASWRQGEWADRDPRGSSVGAMFLPVIFNHGAVIPMVQLAKGHSWRCTRLTAA